MSRLQRVSKTPVALLKMLAQQVRGKTTSEHVLKLRGKAKVSHPKTQNQLAKENLSHMDFMPVPQGSWEESYRIRSMKQSRMLIFSISALGITVYCMYIMNCFFLHTLPSRRQILPDVEKIGKTRPFDYDQL